jgi:hypothetical protein
MSDDARVHLHVALERGGDTIRGTVADGAGPPLDFRGWLELMSAFDLACARAVPDAGGGGPRIGDG